MYSINEFLLNKRFSSAVFRTVTPCTHVDSYQRFGTICYQQFYNFTLKLEAVSSSKTLGTTYIITSYHNQEIKSKLLLLENFISAISEEASAILGIVTCIFAL
jgi:hypothetical protein